MQILSVHLKNIKAHRDAQFHFSPGINVLSGPNGAGKSTLFEAIGYALFGLDAREIVSRAERFITLGEKRGEVAVVFRTAAAETWKAVRTVGANARWLLARERDGAFEVEEHAGAAETEERLRELLALDRGRPLAEQFRLVIGPLQNEFLGPFILKGGKRQEAFDQILGIDAWRRTYEGTREMQRAVEGRIRTLEAEIAPRREQTALLPERRSERRELLSLVREKEGGLKERTDALQIREKELQAQEALRGALEKGSADLKRLSERIADGEEKTAQQRRRVGEAQRSRDDAERCRPGKETCEAAEIRLKDLRLRERQLREIDARVAELEKAHLHLVQREGHEAREIAALRQQLAAESAALGRLEEELRPNPALQPLAERLPELRRDLDACRSARAKLGGRRDSLGEGREKLAAGRCPFFEDDCPNFGSEGGDPFTGRLEELEGEMDRLKEQESALETEVAAAERASREIAVLAARAGDLQRQKELLLGRDQSLKDREKTLEELRPLISQAVEKVESCRREREPFAGLEGEIERAEKERVRHQGDRDRFHAHWAVAADLPAREQTLARYEELLSSLREDLDAREAECRELQEAYRPEVHEAVRRERDGVLSAVASLEQELKGLGERRERLDREIAALEKVAAEVEVKMAELRRCREQEETVKYLRNHVFRHVSARLSERFREAISRRADRIYRTVADTDEELEWGEGYQIVLRDLAGGEVRERTDDQLSGGQTMSAVVALRLALLQTLGARVAFFDEPTSNLDAARRENLARAFRAIDIGREEVTEHWYDQLFLVSHDVAFSEITDQVTEL